MVLSTVSDHVLAGPLSKCVGTSGDIGGTEIGAGCTNIAAVRAAAIGCVVLATGRGKKQGRKN